MEDAVETTAEPAEAETTEEQPVQEEEEVEKPLLGMDEEEKSTSIANAVKDIDTQDILICGKCHEVYYFLEELKEHKEGGSCKGNCEIKDALKDDKKPQIWAFTLWKNTKFRKIAPEEKTTTSWNIYQTWRAMKPAEKQAWLAVASDMQGLFEIVANFEKTKLKILGKQESTDDDEEPNSKSEVVVSKRPNTRRAIRTGSDPKIEHLVEKIISKRYNPRKRTFEYLVKWELFDSEQNTWESSAALQNCSNLMEEFDKNLQIQREQTRLQKTLEKKQKSSAEYKKLVIQGRPQRTCKQKALNQVKAWCGAETDDTSSKRSLSDDSDDEDSMDKRMKVEGDTSSDSDDATPIVTIKRVTKNGVEKKTGQNTITLPENVLVPDGKGIVRINQKLIPSLSSGVYVMSKTAGIIKLDSEAAAKLTSGVGQTILRVAPKGGGQPGMKVVKKEISNGNNSNTAKSGSPPKTIVTQKTPLKNYSGKIYMQRRANQVVGQPKKSDGKNLSTFDDESDGLEELEFPTEIQLPSADSPPPEYTLCPLTGKVLDKDGQVIETEEVEPEPPANITASPSTPMEGVVMNIAGVDMLEDIEEATTATTIVKSGVTLKTIATTAATTKLTSTPTATAIKTIAQPRVSTGPPPLAPATHIKAAVMPSSASTSILSTALTNANIVRRGPPKLVPRSQPKPGILNRTPQSIRQVQERQDAQVLRMTQLQAARQQQQQQQQQQQGGRQQTIYTRVSTPGGTQTRVVQQGQNTLRPVTHVVRKRIIQAGTGGTPQQRTIVRQRVYHQVVNKSSGSPQITYIATPTTTNKVINIPSSTSTTPTTVREKPKQQSAPAKVQQPKVQLTEVQQSPTVTSGTTTTTSATVQQQTPVAASTSSVLDMESDTPLLITGEDGTIYQVAGQNEEGQTILITHGEDGEQQCLLVAPENAGLINQALMKPTAAPAAMQTEEEQPAVIAQQEVDSVEQQLSLNASSLESGEEAADESQVVAQIVSAQPPSPGGTRKVVLMLPDGNFMMTEVTAEQYAALELDK